MKILKEPDYKRIYKDLIEKKLPHREKYCRNILAKNKLEILDVIALNSILFGNNPENQKYKAYNKKAIKKILIYQRKHNLNNLELAAVFSLSRNTITKWNKIMLK